MRQILRIRLIMLCVIGLVMAGQGITYAAPDVRVPEPRRPQATLIIAPTEVTAHAGAPTVFTVRLTTAQGTPLTDKPITLEVDATLELYGRTNAEGIGAFLLPAVLAGEDHELRVIFAGQGGLAAATAVTRLLPHGAATAAARIGADQDNRLLDSATPPPADPARGSARTAQVAAASSGGQEKAPLGVTPWRPTTDQSPANALPTILTVAQQLAVQPEEQAALVARLVTVEGLPLAGQELMLFANALTSLRAVTDRGGFAVFQLPTSLPAGDHELMTVFAGDHAYGPKFALTTLHYHTALPGSDEAASAPVQARAGFAMGTHFASGVSTLASWRTRSALLIAIGLTAVARFGLGAGQVVSLPGVLAMGAFLTLSLAAASGVVRRRWWPEAPVVRGPHVMARLAFLGVPRPVWYGLRVVSIGVALGLAFVLVIRPATGLFLFWRILIPLLPLVFFIAPAVWRNICPMAALNQTPRLLHLTRGLTAPPWMQKYGYLVAISLFLVLASTRKVVFNQNGPVLAVLLLCCLAAAFVMGVVFKGKSGWCSSICPLLPVQRIYGQTPFVTVAHAHCEPCLGCTRNCYDLSPGNAYLADLYDDDRHVALFRRAFVGLFPGFVLAFYLLPNPPDIAVWQMYAGFGLVCAVSIGAYFLAESTLRVTSNKITVVFGAAALNLYYWFNAPALGSLIASPAPMWFVWSLRALVFGLTLFWIQRTYRKERAYIELVLAPEPTESVVEEAAPPIHQHSPNGRDKPPARKGANATAPAVNFRVDVEPEGVQITVPRNRTLLEAIESSQLPIESGCRMGLCGADPICIVAGMDNLSKVGSGERTTLERLALAPNTRLACMARVRGDVKIALAPVKPDIYRSSIVTGFRYDRAIQRVVIVGNGIAGVTAADHIRRRHPHCEIHLIGREPHHLYNRMGITRLIYGRSAMQGLYLLPDQWYDDFNITCWLNTQVTALDPEARTVAVGTGETLGYDRLILTTGSQSFVPPIEGFDLHGAFVLRSAEDAISIRAYVQEQRCRTAVVAGGGLLGLEAAYALYKLGLAVTVLERADTLLARQLDAASAEFLRVYLQGLGMEVVMSTEVAAAQDDAEASGTIRQVVLKDGRTLACDLLLVAAGVRAELDLARAAGLTIRHGVVVDAGMRTSDPHIFAAGDVAEYADKVYGLWPVAVGQAEVAATNAVADAEVATACYVEAAPVTMLKVAGIDVTSIGRIHPESEQETVIALEDRPDSRYRKLVIADGKIVGAILLGYPDESPGVAEAIKQQLDVTPHLDALAAGDWDALRVLT